MADSHTAEARANIRGHRELAELWRVLPERTEGSERPMAVYSRLVRLTTDF